MFMLSCNFNAFWRAGKSHTKLLLKKISHFWMKFSLSGYQAFFGSGLQPHLLSLYVLHGTFLFDTKYNFVPQWK
jgi:hypothetical protein